MFRSCIRLISFLCLIWIFLATSVGWTKCKCEKDETQFKEDVKALEKVYKTAGDFCADFLQEAATTGTIGTVGQKFSGTVRFKKPGKIAWDYKKPEKKSYICNGTTLWIYRPEEGTVEVDEDFVASGSQLVIGFLAGLGDLSTQFEIWSVTRKILTKDVIFSDLPSNLQWWKLVPKDQKEAQAIGFDHMYFGVDPSTFYLVDVVVVQGLGGQTHWRFSKYKFNQGISDKDFEFKIPKNAKVIRR